MLIAPGAIRKLIDYFDANPESNDLLQGPMYYDDMSKVNTHFEPVWRKGMYGIWGKDDRGSKPDAEPFEITMQGLGLFACRKSAWPGFNPDFRGFGGEEGYIHEKFRRYGNKVICLPFLRWLHRFARPMGTPYKNTWEDRIHNYFVGFSELGMDTAPIEQHFSELLNPETVARVRNEIERIPSNPFDYFDAIFCINLDRQTERWHKIMARFRQLGISRRIQRMAAIETPDNYHIGCMLSHRMVIDRAKRLGYKNVLVIEDDALFHAETLDNLRPAVLEAKQLDWDIFYLGGTAWRGLKPLNGMSHIEKPNDTLLALTPSPTMNGYMTAYWPNSLETWKKPQVGLLGI